MCFAHIALEVIANVIGGVILALLFFWAKEKWFPMPDVAGTWYVTLHTTQTTYNPYTGMILRYEAMLWREGHTVRGTVEKISAQTAAGSEEYVGLDRTQGVVEGFLDKNYLGSDAMSLHIREQGQERPSTQFHKLRVLSNTAMSGVFDSTVASQRGTVTWQRDPF